MASEAVKLARLERDRVVSQAVIDGLVTILTNPGILLVGGTAAIEYLQGHNEVVLRADEAGAHKWKTIRVPGGSWFGSVAGTVAEGGLVANASQGLLTGDGKSSGLLTILAGLLK